MARISNKAATIIGLERMGWTVDNDARTKIYTAYVGPHGARQRFYVGRSGAFRYSKRGVVSESVSWTDRRTHRLIQVVGRAPAQPGATPDQWWKYAGENSPRDWWG